MYRFVETEKVDGKTCRTGGVTRKSLAAMKHLAKLGNLKYVRGYTYRGRYGVVHIGVLVAGENGTIRFGGFNWGYGGEGPRGLGSLFLRLGVCDTEAEANRKAYEMGPSPDFSTPKEYWRIAL